MKFSIQQLAETLRQYKSIITTLKRKNGHFLNLKEAIPMIETMICKIDSNYLLTHFITTSTISTPTPPSSLTSSSPTISQSILPSPPPSLTPSLPSLTPPPPSPPSTFFSHSTFSSPSSLTSQSPISQSIISSPESPSTPFPKLRPIFKSNPPFSSFSSLLKSLSLPSLASVGDVLNALELISTKSF